MRPRVVTVAIGLALLVGASGISLVQPVPRPPAVGAQGAFDDLAFGRVWIRTEKPVFEGAVARSWLWGPSPLSYQMYERYLDSPADERRVQYFDKGRMELSDPAGDPFHPWYVTSGLLTRELISGRLQIGDDAFLDSGQGAAVAVAGDPDNAFPTYADLARIVDTGAPDLTGQAARRVLLPDGETDRPAAGDDPNARLVRYVTYEGPQGAMVGYNIPRAFWEFMTQPGLVEEAGSTYVATPFFDWLFVLGYPIADPFWVQVRVAGTPRWVLVQPFERRVLTYTPANPAGWQVEMGNIGQHYYRWRYARAPMVTVGPGAGHFAMIEGSYWTYGTSAGVDEHWRITGTSRSFSGGSTLIARREETPSGVRVTYWSVTSSGLSLYGIDRLDGDDQISDSTVFWPPIRLLPGGGPREGQTLVTETRVLSMRAAPRDVTVTVEVTGQQRVSVPAGVFPSWRLRITQTEVDPPPAAGRLLPYTLWFTPTLGTVAWLDVGFAAQLEEASTYVGQ